MKIGVFGLGLIGGSFGRAVLKFTNHEVYGFDTDGDAMIKATLLNAQTAPLDDNMLKHIDMAVIALCPNATMQTMRDICPKLKDGAIIIDTCGNKRKIVDEMQNLNALYPNLNFAGVHPMAGREFSGISHSTASLFEKAYIIMVSVTKDVGVLSAIKNLFISIGAQDVEMCSAKKHDEMIAYTSQLAHIVSSSYIKNEHSSEHAGFSAGSFRDLTRVAKLNPEMWTELFMDNRDNLIYDIDVLISHLKEYRDALETGDAQTLKYLLKDGVKMKERAEAARKERLK